MNQNNNVGIAIIIFLALLFLVGNICLIIDCFSKKEKVVYKQKNYRHQYKKVPKQIYIDDDLIINV